MELEDSSSPEDFPGLFERNSSKSKKGSEESGDQATDILPGKKLENKKDKKSKEKKDRQSYEALGGESEEEDHETKLFRSPSKSKKLKTFKFPSKKEKREKSREPDLKDVPDGSMKDKKSKEEQKAEKKKAKKEKEKKSKSNSLTNSNEVYDIGDIQPIFGVSLGLAVERSRCHDEIKLPLVVRDCIDFLQEHGLNSEQIYKMEGVKTRLQSLKKSYNNRESRGEELDVPTACSLLKAYLLDLQEPILTTELTTRFEEASALPDVKKQAEELEALIEQLPNCNQILLSWLFRHFSDVINNEKTNKLNAQSLAVLLSPVLQMSHRLMITVLCHAETLFADVELKKYIPPITSTSPNFPETPEEITTELKKQESLLAQIHSEMNAGFVTKKREEELWETQRISTQLKRKLRMFEKRNDSMQKSIDIETVDESIDFTMQTAPPEESKIPLSKENLAIPEAEVAQVPAGNQKTVLPENFDRVFIGENGYLMLHKDHPQYSSLIRLQLENQELLNWKQQLQSKIQSERAEGVKLKKLVDAMEPETTPAESQSTLSPNDPEIEKLIDFYIKENSLLEQKFQLLAKEIYDENLSLIQLMVECRIKEIVH